MTKSVNLDDNSQSSAEGAGTPDPQTDTARALLLEYREHWANPEMEPETPAQVRHQEAKLTEIDAVLAVLRSQPSELEPKEWLFFASELRCDASGESGRMSATSMYRLAEHIEALAASVRPNSQPSVPVAALKALEQKWRYQQQWDVSGIVRRFTDDLAALIAHAEEK